MHIKGMVFRSSDKVSWSLQQKAAYRVSTESAYTWALRMNRLVQIDTFHLPYNLIQLAFQTTVDGGSFGGTDNYFGIIFFFFHN